MYWDFLKYWASKGDKENDKEAICKEIDFCFRK